MFLVPPPPKIPPLRMAIVFTFGLVSFLCKRLGFLTISTLFLGCHQSNLVSRRAKLCSGLVGVVIIRWLTFPFRHVVGVFTVLCLIGHCVVFLRKTICSNCSS